ncbi:MAG: DUF4423 domain-containing protein [Pseudobacteriovorax sp.]|nr:DUF4423 domain-containing protein [Pseudobacteriovorax sp.]
MTSLKETLRSEFAERKSRNPSYSLRAYARFLEISPTSLSLFLNGKRGLSEKAKRPILRKLGFLDGELDTDDFSEIDLDKVKIIADWYFFAILSLMETDDYQHDCQWIGQRLNISQLLAKEAISILEKNGFIEFDDKNKAIPTFPRTKTPTQVRSAAIRKSHMQALDLAKRSLEYDDISLRDMTAITVVTTRDKMNEARKKITKFRRNLMKFLESGEKKEVYRLSIQLFPLSKVRDDI